MIGTWWQRFYYAYFLGPDHPMKLRICYYLRRLMKDGRVTIPYDGSGWITVDELEFIERHILLHGYYEPEVFETLMRFAQADEVVWDIGANVGSFSIRAMRDPRVALTCAFEPLPPTFTLLARNVAMNPGMGMLWNLALSDSLEDQSLSFGTPGNIGMASMEDHSGSNQVTVRCSTMDHLVENGFAKPPTLVKMDVEGWEGPVFRGSLKTLARYPPKAIVFESRSTAAGVLEQESLGAILKENGYRFERIVRPQGTIEPRENFIAVRS